MGTSVMTIMVRIFYLHILNIWHHCNHMALAHYPPRPNVLTFLPEYFKATVG